MCPGSTLGRIAIRRPDGGWDFAHPNEPYLPSGISDPYPSPASVRTTFFSSHKFQRDASETSNPAILEYKAQESRAAQMIRLGYDARDHDLEMGDRHLPHPPPAYGQEPSVATYRPSPTRDTLRSSITASWISFRLSLPRVSLSILCMNSVIYFSTGPDLTTIYTFF